MSYNYIKNYYVYFNFVYKNYIFYKITSKIMRGGKRSKAYKNFFLFLYDFKRLLWNSRFILWLLPFYDFKNDDQSFFNKFLKVNDIKSEDKKFINFDYYHKNINKNLSYSDSKIKFFFYKGLFYSNLYNFKPKFFNIFFNKYCSNFNSLLNYLFYIYTFKNYLALGIVCFFFDILFFFLCY